MRNRDPVYARRRGRTALAPIRRHASSRASRARVEIEIALAAPANERHVAWRRRTQPRPEADALALAGVGEELEGTLENRVTAMLVDLVVIAPFSSAVPAIRSRSPRRENTSLYSSSVKLTIGARAGLAMSMVTEYPLAGYTGMRMPIRRSSGAL